MIKKSTFEVWNFLKEKYEGDERIKGMCILKLIREFDLQKMKYSETFKEHLDRLLNIANKFGRIIEYFRGIRIKRLLKSKGYIDGALFARVQSNQGDKRKKIKCKRRKTQTNIAQIADQEKEKQLFVATCFAISSSSDKWIINSGCTNHMTFDCDLFRELHTSIIPKVQNGNGDYISIKGKGIVVITCSSGTKLINDMLFVPNINKNLLSFSRFLEKGFKVVFELDQCQIKDVKGKYVFKVMMKGISFALVSLEQAQKVYAATKINAEVWHKRLGHFNHAAVLNLQKKDLVQGLSHLKSNILDYKTC
ncbi:Retrovirus-related Pol polyprotein from transposon TNT 1-94 [Gossypium australe]|uniref:Retrovirus-related Pol polyprotein from transposon TNT 1-94 n=1 Tax=Gossypium australe TaxID=47621 RepID=A0A5B6WGR1_9ROSI|nr:Retrovirus-related Pol polyprotein from transposon TNT 1-94 [Gossypium australe]